MQAVARKRLASGIRWAILILALALVGLGVTIVFLTEGELPPDVPDNPLYQTLNVLMFLFPTICLVEGVYFLLFGREHMEWTRDMRSRNRWYSRFVSQKYSTPGWIRGMGWFWMVYGALFLAVHLWRVLALR